jgi:dihydrofolate reductase
MSFSIVAAIAANNVIGKNHKMPWRIPEELKHFYKIIHGKPIIIGRKTHESIGGPIENSQNIVLSREAALQLTGCKVINSITAALNLYHDDTEIMVIGGASVYHQFLPFVSKMYLTFIDQQFDGDAYFPEWQRDEWESIEESAIQTASYPCRFVTFQRK